MFVIDQCCIRFLTEENTLRRTTIDCSRLLSINIEFQFKGENSSDTKDNKEKIQKLPC